MKILLDTHILLWWLFDEPKLCAMARAQISNLQNEIYVSSASAWEIATKYHLGKMPEAKDLLRDYQGIIRQARFIELVITTKYALYAGMLKIKHRDPFDRMLMAQAELDNLAIITYDSAFYLEFRAFNHYSITKLSKERKSCLLIKMKIIMILKSTYN